MTGHNGVIREQNVLGDHVQIWNNTTVDYGCRIGDHVEIHTNCYIAQFTKLEGEVVLAPDDLTCRTGVATEGHSYHPYTHRTQQSNPEWLCASR